MPGRGAQPTFQVVGLSANTLLASENSGQHTQALGRHPRGWYFQ
ncbi:MAG TPA: hypothetical protein VK797_13270 [Tepidisphaeraceae bacterium]|jgi:hypothetical protein|nr:hypothetical protein [Tepidisphaeraceae bacterium]